MIVLGLNSGTHDSSAALVINGKVVGACEEERFNGKKHTKEFPAKSIDAVLDIANISIKEVDKISVNFKPWKHVFLAYNILLNGFPQSTKYIPYIYRLLNRGLELKKELKFRYGKACPAIVFVDHHLCHAACSYYLSSFNSATIVTCDGRGEYESMCAFHAQGHKIEKIGSIKYPHSLGYFYNTVTKYLGFTPWHDEYKVMGLAAYGRPSLEKKFEDILKIKGDNKIELVLKYFDHHYNIGNSRKWYTSKLDELLNSIENTTSLGMDIASSAQTSLQNALLKYTDWAIDKTGELDLCMAGGVALNCVANSYIASNSKAKEIFINSAPNDAGSALGAALIVDKKYSPQKARKKINISSPYLGPKSCKLNWDILDKGNKEWKVTKLNHPAKAAASLIFDSKVIAWFQGRMEFGPRALGNRNILAAPTSEDMKDYINEKIKFREKFRPFAPAVLEEYANEYFDITTSAKHLYYYMLSSVDVRSCHRNEIPAVIHVDGTARIQTVSKSVNNMFWQLINEYYQLSNIPVVLSTSFNTKDVPIVASVEDAIKCFMNTDLDYLIIGDYLLEKSCNV